MKSKKDYISFDRYIKGFIREGKFDFNTPEIQLREELKRLGIHRVKDISSGHVLNNYPSSKQLQHVTNVIHDEKPHQVTFDNFKEIFVKSHYRRYGKRRIKVRAYSYERRYK
jgi:hypothetical protein